MACFNSNEIKWYAAVRETLDRNENGTCSPGTQLWNHWSVCGRFLGSNTDLERLGMSEKLIGWFLEKNCKCRIRQHETNIQQFHLNVQFRNLYTHFSSLSILILVCLGGPYYRQSEILSFSFWYYRNMFPYLLDRNLGYRSVLTRNLQ